MNEKHKVFSTLSRSEYPWEVLGGASSEWVRWITIKFTVSFQLFSYLLMIFFTAFVLTPSHAVQTLPSYSSVLPTLRLMLSSPLLSSPAPARDFQLKASLTNREEIKRKARGLAELVGWMGRGPVLCIFFKVFHSFGSFPLSATYSLIVLIIVALHSSPVQTIHDG